MAPLSPNARHGMARVVVQVSLIFKRDAAAGHGPPSRDFARSSSPAGGKRATGLFFFFDPLFLNEYLSRGGGGRSSFRENRKNATAAGGGHHGYGAATEELTARRTIDECRVTVGATE